MVTVDLFFFFFAFTGFSCFKFRVFLCLSISFVRSDSYVICLTTTPSLR